MKRSRYALPMLLGLLVLGIALYYSIRGNPDWRKFDPETFLQTLRKDRAALGVDSVFIGKSNTHPEHSPFVLQRNCPEARRRSRSGNCSVAEPKPAMPLAAPSLARATRSR
jgi:hypothetical protein